ncbi:unnamed protein product, partial [Symbiodinium pilosum]
MIYHADASRTKILTVIKWSFQSLSEGTYPFTDPWNNPFTKTYFPDRLALAGQRICGPYIGIFDGVQADLEFVKKIFCLQ